MSFYGTRTATTSTAGGSATSSQNSYYNKMSSTNVPSGPSDTITQLGWSSDGNFLTCTSWDGTMRLWHISQGFGSQFQPTPKISIDAKSPLLSSTFGLASNHLFVGSCDKTAKLYDLNASTTNPQVVAQHEQPVCSVAWNPVQNVLVTASWDGFIKMWDGKQQHPLWQQSVGGKIFRMGIHSPFLCVCDNFRNVLVLDLSTLFHHSSLQRK
ncbi:mrna export protein, partial [Cystoisospora suis]